MASFWNCERRIQGIFCLYCYWEWAVGTLQTSVCGSSITFVNYLTQWGLNNVGLTGLPFAWLQQNPLLADHRPTANPTLSLSLLSKCPSCERHVCRLDDASRRRRNRSDWAKERTLMWDTHEEHTDVISYLTANTLPLNCAENLLVLHMRTVAVCSENYTKDTNRRFLCSCVVQQVTLHSVAGVCAVPGGADKSSARPTSRCRRTGSIVSLERGVCSGAELQVFSCYRGWKEACQATRAISTTSRRELPSVFFPARQGAEGNSRHSDRNIRRTCTTVCHRQKLGGPV